MRLMQLLVCIHAVSCHCSRDSCKTVATQTVARVRGSLEMRNLGDRDERPLKIFSCYLALHSYWPLHQSYFYVNTLFKIQRVCLCFHLIYLLSIPLSHLMFFMGLEESLRGKGRGRSRSHVLFLTVFRNDIQLKTREMTWIII